MKKFLLIALFVFISVPSNAEYDPQNTMLALNMAIVSVNRILTTEDRVVLEWEYENIINRLAIGNIKSDSEIQELYDELLSFINGKHLRQEDMKRIRESYKQREQEAYYRAMSAGLKNLRAPENDSLLSWIGGGIAFSAVSSTGAGYYYYQASKEQIHQEISNGEWQLKKEELEACNKLQTTLLNSSWTLLSKYHLPNEYRLTQENVREFLSVMNESDSLKRLGRLKFIERKFRSYPPYWYFRASTAMNARDESECRKCFERFNDVWRPVLNYDPYKLEAVKYEIRELAEEGTGSRENADRIRELVEMIRDYAPPSDWESNIFAGIVYFALGDKDEGINCIEYGNIVPGYETEVSGALLAFMKGDSDVSALPQKSIDLYEKLSHNLSREQLIRKADNGDLYAQNMLGKKYYDENNYDKAIYWYRKAAEKGYAPAQNNLGEMYYYCRGVKEDNAEAFKWYRKSAGQGYAPAQFNLGFMYEQGWGVKQNYDKAVKWYLKAAMQGNESAQKALERLR